MTEERVIHVLRAYRVQKLYRATTEAKATRYAVFTQGKQITEPRPHAEALRDWERIVAREIVANQGVTVRGRGRDLGEFDPATGLVAPVTRRFE